MPRPRLAAALVLAALAAGCGGGSDPEAAGPSTTAGTLPPITTSLPGTTAATGTQPSGSSAPGTAPPAADGPPPPLRLTRVAPVDQPTAFAVRAGDTALYVTEQPGRVKAFRGGSALDAAPVLDLTDRVLAGGERGLLGLAFSPDGSTLYAYWTAKEPVGQLTIAAYPMRGGAADRAGERVLLTIPHDRYGNHNGGQLVVTPDGHLWAGTGDGGGGGDPLGNSRRTDSLLGKLLRIDPTRQEGGRPYAIPAANPFVRGGGAPEVWAFGLRNPWRFSFDRPTGDLWVADVGQNQYEEVNVVPATRAGADYGWNLREALHPYRDGALPTGAVQPVVEIDHDADGACSVTGGFVYRGARIPGLVGRYLFADVCDGTLRAVRRGGDGRAAVEATSAEGQQVRSFGEDLAGELYVLDGRGLHRIDPG